MTLTSPSSRRLYTLSGLSSGKNREKRAIGSNFSEVNEGRKWLNHWVIRDVYFALRESGLGGGVLVASLERASRRETKLG